MVENQLLIAMAFEQDAFSQDVRLGIVEAAERTRF